ncbi:MAG: hypothetical protein J6Q85_02660 [Clostridia bacterium]|nr:hypothetical protein [Clostridia bacterium]
MWQNFLVGIGEAPICFHSKAFGLAVADYVPMTERKLPKSEQLIKRILPSVEDYAELVCTVNNLDPEGVTAKDGFAEFTYEKELNGKNYYYYARCFKNGTDFWLFQFACETKNTEKLTPSFEKWASTVTFGE